MTVQIFRRADRKRPQDPEIAERAALLREMSVPLVPTLGAFSRRVDDLARSPFVPPTLP